MMCHCRHCADLEWKLKTEQLDGAEVLTFPPTLMRMFLCPKCGNKRCPHANYHGEACTGSNAAGQPGSAYPQMLMMHGRKTHTEWVRINTDDSITGSVGDWKLVELPDESRHSLPLRTLAWIYTFDGLTWQVAPAQSPGLAKFGKELDGVTFGDPEEAKRYIEVLLRMEGV